MLAESWSAAPRDAQFFLDQAEYHQAEGRAEAALAAADRAIVAAAADEPLADRGRIARIAALRSLGRAGEARSEVLAEIARSPGAAWAHTELARYLTDDGKHEEARAELDRALSIDPSEPAALALRFYPGDPTDLVKMAAALPALTAFAEAHGEQAGPWRVLARAKAVLGSDDEAVALFARGIALAPSDDGTRAEFWALLERLRRFDVLLADAATLTDLNKRDWKLRFSEAEAYRGLGKSIEARAAFTALNLDTSLQVEVRKRAKRAVMSMGAPAGEAAP